MFQKIISVAVLALILCGCVSVKHIPLTASASEALSDKKIILTKYKKADFTAFTAGKAAFAVVGAAAMVAAGNKITLENSIPDPALAIAAGLLERLQNSRSVQILPNQKVASSDKITDLVMNHPNADYLLDVKTLTWMFNYYPSDWSHYKVTYRARMRLINSSNKKVVAETMCTTVQGDDNNPPTKDDLLKDNASLLKEYLNKATISCVDVLSEQVLMLGKS